MKKIFLFGLFACAIGACVNAYADGFVETETVKTHEKISIDTIKYYDTAYIKPAPKPKPVPPKAEPKKVEPCHFTTSLDVAHKCNCEKAAPKKLNPVRVKTYTEVIDHYQLYQPIIVYEPAGTYTTRRFIDSPKHYCGTCIR